MQLFLKSVKHFDNKIAHVLVRNLGLEDDWSSVEEMEEVQNAIKKYEVKVIDFPKFYSRERNAIDAQGIRFDLARNSQELGVLGRQRINKTLASYERVAVEKQEGQIAEAVNSLVHQTELTRVATSARSLVVAAGILLTTLGVGALMGWMGLLWSQGGFAPGD